MCIIISYHWKRCFTIRPHVIFGSCRAGYELGGSGLSGVLSLLADVQQGSSQTFCSCFSWPRFFHFVFNTSLPLPLLPPGSVESKVEPSLLELENSESLFSKTSDSDLAPCLHSSLLSSSFFLCVSMLFSSLPLCLCPHPPPPSLCCLCWKVERRRWAKDTSVIWFRSLFSWPGIWQCRACMLLFYPLQSAIGWPCATAVTGPSVVYK